MISQCLQKSFCFSVGTCCTPVAPALPSVLFGPTFYPVLPVIFLSFGQEEQFKSTCLGLCVWGLLSDAPGNTPTQRLEVGPGWYFLWLPSGAWDRGDVWVAIWASFFLLRPTYSDAILLGSWFSRTITSVRASPWDEVLHKESWTGHSLIDQKEGEGEWTSEDPPRQW